MREAHLSTAVFHLESCEHGVRFADDAHDHRALLDSFLCVFDLEDAALR